MAAAFSVDRFLESKGFAYQTIRRDAVHRGARAGLQAVPAYRVVKTLLLVEGDAHALVVIPKDRRIDLLALNREFHRRFLLGGPDDAVRLYPGLPLHALLPAGIDAAAEIFVDQSLVGLGEIVFETGDPGRWVRIAGADFTELFDGAWCARISRAR